MQVYVAPFDPAVQFVWTAVRLDADSLIVDNANLDINKPGYQLWPELDVELADFVRACCPVENLRSG